MEDDDFTKYNEKASSSNDLWEKNESFTSDSIEFNALDTLPKKSPLSYVIVVLSLAIVLALFYFFIKRDILTVSGIAVGFLILIILSLRKPKNIEVIINQTDILIDNKSFNLRDYQSFSVRDLAGGFKILLIKPVKRFTPSLNVYLMDKQSSDKITAYLSHIIPYNSSVNNFIDTVLQWLGI